MNEQIEKLEHGLMVCEVTGTKLVHIEKADAEKILGLLKEQESVIEALKSDLAETLEVLVQKPDVVLCKDCKWWENGLCKSDDVSRKIDDCGCYPDFRTSSDWFCGDRERKD